MRVAKLKGNKGNLKDAFMLSNSESSWCVFFKTDFIVLIGVP